MENEIKKLSGGGMVFSGPEAVNVYSMIVLASGLDMYAKAKIIPNRHYTPSKMLAWAGKWTGKTFKRGQYAEAAIALRAKAQEVRSTF